MDSRVLWHNIETRLDRSCPRWRGRIQKMGQLEAVKARSEGGTWCDDEVFKALLLAVLSANTDWKKIEALREELPDQFSGFSLAWYAKRSESDTRDRFLPWFKKRKAGSVNLRTNLVNLVCAAQILLQRSSTHGTADGYFTSLLDECGGDPKQVALRLGCAGADKLPAFGVPLAAEALKNLGFDVAKPDRHIMRAIGSFGLVRFNRWQSKRDEGGGRQPPGSTSRKRLRDVMAAVEKIASAANERVAFVDNAIWLLGAKSGLHLTNRELAAIARKSQSPEDQ